MKIYVCGGSAELAVVSAWMDALRDAGHEITHDWTEVVRAEGEGNPRDATHAQRSAWAEADLQGIGTADLVWGILPTTSSFGCAFELGYAVALGKQVIVSGDWRRSIFSCRALLRFETHNIAFEAIRNFR
jgi:nucleoside 2-deoxyribosyltransferase